jgi:hypothetical protein
MALVPGGPSEQLAWLREQVATGKLDGDDPDDVGQAEALLRMLVISDGTLAAVNPRRHSPRW